MRTGHPTMARRRSCHALLALTGLAGAFALASCRSVVDSGITYRDCDRNKVGEGFDVGSTIEALSEKCWEIANDDDNVFVDDGDLILRMKDRSAEPQRWGFGTQGPMIFQHFEGNFVMAARLEVLEKQYGSLCLPPDNEVGLVVRQTVPELAWTTVLISPFDVDDPCESTGEPEFPIQARVRRSAETDWGPEALERGPDDTGIAFREGETDVAVCRFEGTVTYYYRDPATTVDEPTWLPIGEPVETGANPVDVGPTASGGQELEVEGHFTWVGYSDRDVGDGCTGQLQLLTLPVLE